VDLPYVILTLLTVPVRVARMKDLPNDAIASTAPVRKAACSAGGTANARLGQLWLDPLAADRGAAASMLQTYRDDLATAALRLTADAQLERLTLGMTPSRHTAALSSWLALMRSYRAYSAFVIPIRVLPDPKAASQAASDRCQSARNQR
jgi:hypothetical protein